MTLINNNPTPDSARLVEQVARLVRTFNPQQMAQLVQLVPQLQTIQSQSEHYSAEQAELAAYFDQQLEAFSEYPPMQDDAPFICGLSVKEFFTLPEAEQDRIWNEAHIEAERQLEDDEQPVQPDALPAR
jgi:hypothetical protein